MSEKKESDTKQKTKPQLVSKSKVTSCLSKDKGHVRLKKNKIVEKAISQKRKTCKKNSSLGGISEKHTKTSAHSEKVDDKDVKATSVKKRRKKKKENNEELDEASRLQRKTRYLLIKMKLEQNFVDAYSAEGWKGQSREKIKPEKELQRAKHQILKCKLGIRDAIHQLDLLSSVGRINDSAVAPDGSVHHEHIVCAKCKLREAFPDNDIILCDGTCNCAFHQKCLDPPLLTENIPPGDEGWFCKFCKKKIEILEATNANLGTHFPLDSDWKDIFKKEASIPEGENSMLCQEELWPSDDSADDDYDPVSLSDSSNCNFSSLGSLEEETFLEHGRIRKGSQGSFTSSLEMIGVNTDEFGAEVLSRPRQRASVDYIQLYDEMFGNNTNENEQITDDEDWGPTKKKRKVKVTDAAIAPMPTGKTEINILEETSLEPKEGHTKKKRKVKGTDVAIAPMPAGETETNLVEETTLEPKEKVSNEKMKRPIFRFPQNAVEKLRLAFAENELPTKSARKSLSEQLGLGYDKINKWFKNARYLALKARKTEGANSSGNVSPSVQKEPTSKTEKGEFAKDMASNDNTMTESLSKHVRRRKPDLILNSLNIKQQKKLTKRAPDSLKTTVDIEDDVSLKHFQEKAKAAKRKTLNSKKPRTLKAEAEMERLCQIKNRVEKLREVLLQLPISKFTKPNKSNTSTVYVPVAELKEKG